MLPPVSSVFHRCKLVHQQSELAREIHVRACKNVPASLVGRHLQELDEMEPLQTGAVVVVELVGE